MKRELAGFYEDLRERVDETCEEWEPSEASKSQAFVEHVLAQMMNQDLVEDYSVIYYEKPKYLVNGWGLSSDESTLYLVAADYAARPKPETLTKAEVDSKRSRLLNFLKGATSGVFDNLPPGEEKDFITRIPSLWSGLTKVKFLLLFDRVGKDYRYDEETVDDLPVSTEFWDLERLFKDLSPGGKARSVDIELKDYGASIQVLDGGGVEGVYRSYLAVLPGELVARIYAEHGSTLMERNVRSFLQFKTNVNKGIRRTILEEPEMFLTYNNGLSATASKVVVERTKDGLFIQRLEDFQIVNGGQTTASLHRAMLRDRVDVSRVRVQVKLTEVLDRQKMDEIVPNISRCSNSQNAVQEADFSANEPFHRKLQQLSRSIIVPDPTGGKRSSYWFYERARGQYEVEKGKATTPAAMKQFKAENPSNQRFDKLAVAKVVNGWDFQEPHEVSKGSQKNFSSFSRHLMNGELPKDPDAVFFRQLVAKLILFRSMDELVRKRMEPGYKANIVAYTLAWFSKAVKRKLPAELIWKEQEIRPFILDQLHRMAIRVREILVATEGTSNVTEWAKNPKVWTKVQNEVFPLASPSFMDEYEALVAEEPGFEGAWHVGVVEANEGAKAAAQLEAQVKGMKAEEWEKLMAEGMLSPADKGFINTLVRALKAGRPVKPYLVQAGVRALRRIPEELRT